MSTAAVVGEAVTSGHVDYLQRVGLDGAPPSRTAPWTLVPPGLRRLSVIRGVGRYVKYPPGGGPADAGERGRRPPLGVGLLGALQTYQIPLAFLAGNDGARTGWYLGTWDRAGPGSPAPQTMDYRQDLVLGALRSLWPVVDATPAGADPVQLGVFSHAGLVLGVPSAPSPDPLDPVGPLDRLLRGAGPGPWAFLVLADPVDAAWAMELRRATINELRAVRQAERTGLGPSPLADHYSELLAAQLRALTVGHALGHWRTAVYLFGDAASYYRLASLWQGVFLGAESLAEPVRVWDLSQWPAEARRLVAGWGLPEEAAPPGPGLYRHPFGHQSLLNTIQLGAYVGLPEEEASGFEITLVPRFDAVPRPVAAEPAIDLGRVVQRRAPTPTAYRLDARVLARHLLVAGITGSGKTNTLLHMLAQVDRAGVPFLVIEPAKSEYRALRSDPALAGRLRVFTPGEERISPLRLNPFEVPAGTSVARHLDLLRAVFTASFGMWTPLPQVLERCLYAVYADHGWDLASGQNPRLAGGPSPDAFPTLAELIAKVDAVVPALGYEERVASDIHAALTTRLESLRQGGKGRMLDTRQSVPLAELLAHPAVLELEWMGDDDDKAFVMALLLARLAEHRRAEGESSALRHLLVIEEAHRLLSAVPPRRAEDEADPRGKAVETFTQLLSEVRAYGQGVVIADQIPVRLAPDVIKNTGLKIAHRTVAEDDRLALAGAMGMDAGQARALGVLGRGEAAVLGEGDDAPLLVAVPRAGIGDRPTDEQVAAGMSRWRAAPAVAAVFRAAAFCGDTCATAAACAAARDALRDPVVQGTLNRLALSAIADPGAVDRQWDDLVLVLRARAGGSAPEPDLLRACCGHGAHWYASRLGAAARWPYQAAAELSALLRAVLLARLSGAPAGPEREALRAGAARLMTVPVAPFPACELICGRQAGVRCAFRHAAAELAASRRYADRWQAAEREDALAPDGRRTQTWQACQDAAYDLVEFPEDDWPPELRESVAASARRAALCFGQQAVLNDPAKPPRTARRVMARLLWEAGL